ncbi:MAG: hypothetical protein V3W52_17300 [Syntrophobacteria bacterium]
MATLGSSLLTLLDWAKRLDPDGKTDFIVEQLSQDNEILTEMLWKEGNLPTGERTTIRTGLPSTFWRLINEGVPNSKSTTAQITEDAGMLTARSQVDKAEAELNGNVSSFRLSESMAFLEGMNQEMADTLFYGSAANPEEFVGFSNRYNDLSAVNGQNILDAGGSSSDNSSIWFVGWGPREVFGVFPKGSSAGLQHEDLGLDDAFDSSDNRFRAYMDEYVWKAGLVVKDWRFAVRIANIDISDLTGQTGTQASTAATAIVKLMSRAIDRLPRLSGVNTSFYANRTIISNLRVAAMDKSASAVTIDPSTNQFGETIHTTRFFGHPVRVTDALTEAETQVS